jgi:hypothetical protein
VLCLVKLFPLRWMEFKEVVCVVVFDYVVLSYE